MTIEYLTIQEKMLESKSITHMNNGANKFSPARRTMPLLTEWV
jgi:hypothetical protein